MKALYPNSNLIPCQIRPSYFKLIWILTAVLLANVFLFSTHVVLAQYDCNPPTLLSPFSWQSVDPPIFTWVPPPNPPFHCYDQLECRYGYTCPPLYYSNLFYASASAGYHVVTNSEWNNYPVNLPQCYCLVHGGYWSNGSYCVYAQALTRLPAALPPAALLLPLNGAVNVILTPLLDWSPVVENLSASNYKVTIYDSPRLANIVFDSVTIYDSIRVPGGRLTGNTAYWWRVKPYGNGGEGPYCDPWNFTTSDAPPPPPQPPVLLRPLNNSSGMPLTDTLVWNSSTGAISYRLQVALDAGFSSIILNDSTLTSTTRIISGLSPLTTYYWRVNAKNSGGSGGWSLVWNFRTKGNPSQVTLYLPLNNATNIPTTFTFKWSKAIDQTTRLLVSYYWFEKVTDTVSMANLLRDSTLSDTLKIVTGMNNNTSYYWRVRARNEIGWGNFASWFKFTTVPAIPAAPLPIAPPDNATGLSLTPLIDWSAVSGAVSYRLQVTTDSTFTTITALDSANIIRDSLRIPGGKLDNNIKYFWRVNASNPGGTGPWSVVWKFTTTYLGLVQVSNEIPKEYKLYYNYPNPFNPLTKIRFDLPKPGFVTVNIFDILGREVLRLVNEQLDPGTYEINFDGSNYPSGIYFYKLETEYYTNTKKMVLIK